MENMRAAFAGVQDFVASVEGDAAMERMQIPHMQATMYFKKPDKVHFASKGFFLMPREGAALNPDALWLQYDASLAGGDTVDGKPLIKLQLAAKEEKTRLRQLYVWIDPASWTIAHLQTVPYEGRTLSLQFSYERVQDAYWLPSKVTVSFGSVAEKNASSDEAAPQGSGPMALGRAPRSGSVTLMYSNYLVNHGIDDSIFENQEK
jgi:outer membrane lipoprotein-sorting protein